MSKTKDLPDSFFPDCFDVDDHDEWRLVFRDDPMEETEEFPGSVYDPDEDSYYEHDLFLELIKAVSAGGIPYGRAIIMVASFAVAVQERTRKNFFK